MGKAKDGSECFTRQNKSGGSYVTCEGTQKARKSASKAKSAESKPKQKKPIPPNSARAKGRRSAAARKLTTRPAAAGRIDTGAPRNVGKVVTEKPKFKDDKPKKVKKTYQQRAKEIFENFKRDFGGREHYAQVQVEGYHDLNWDGYNLYKKDLHSRGDKVGTYQNEAHLEEWRDYGHAQAFTKWEPLKLDRDAKGLKLKDDKPKKSDAKTTNQKKIDENVKTYKRLKAKYEKMKIAELRKLVPASVLGDAKTRTGFKTKIDFVLYLTKKGLPHKLDYEDTIKMNKEVRKK